MSSLDGINPNGTWSLFANDDQVLGSSIIMGGWCLNITTTTFTGPTTTTTGPTSTTTLPNSGPVLTLDGPATATVGCETPPTVTARLLVNGFAEANATVAFTVAGPAPAVPADGTATTGGDGRASFTFTAPQAGDYTVTAAVTHAGVEKTARHTVRFKEPKSSVTLDGPATGQTEETTTVTATVDDGCGPLAGAPVDFAATWPAQDRPWTGQATPSTGTATTDADGRARFSFTADRAGDYAMTASTPVAQQSSAIHTVRMDVLTFKRVASIPLSSGDLNIATPLMDPAGRYIYVVTENPSRSLRKIDLTTTQVVGDILLGSWPMSAVIDPAGRYAYVVVENGVEKIDLGTLERVGSIAMETGPGNSGVAPALMDPAGRFLHVGSPVASVEAPDGTTSTAAGVVKVDLNTFQRVGAIHLDTNDEPLVGVVGHASGDWWAGRQTDRTESSSAAISSTTGVVDPTSSTPAEMVFLWTSIANSIDVRAAHGRRRGHWTWRSSAS